MSGSETIAAAKGFLDLIKAQTPPSDEMLIASLDRLLSAYHLTPLDADIVPQQDAPRIAWDAHYTEIGKHFADYGLYAVADPLQFDPDISMLTGDAIDDIADIAKDMAAVVWHAQNESTSAAHWAFRNTYAHWGGHARELSLYLFARTLR